jgi:hypothetical protein
VHAVDDNAVAFYERFGFQGLTAMPRTLMVTLSALRAAGFLGPTVTAEHRDARRRSRDRPG